MDTVTVDDLKDMVNAVRHLALTCASEYGHGDENDPDPSVEWALGYEGDELKAFEKIRAIAFPEDV